ncbi:4'-phosphopantetheinyl transferase superfamily protein [Arthrobacter silvisoli]|uniref:4'-phosphopantetheinyl transferase superfamily protein n=1 Tax=Arthrobacter silvisoli TaxID=2291022 RepID=UPI0014448C76|nr:4'-phosphopantetheinyl transferase superfamily protein [Arthrobacter silvisoli]
MHTTPTDACRLMYMQQYKLVHVHASSRNFEKYQLFGICHPPFMKTEIFTAPSGPDKDVGAELVARVLGASARRYFRSPNRQFPLAFNGAYFSVSHTASMTALAVSTVPIGIDVECRIATDAVALMDWALSKTERAEVARRGPEELAEIWTAKEAAGKAAGVGLQPTPAGILTMAISELPGHRSAWVPDSSDGPAEFTTCGSWQGDQHLRIAWPTDTDNAH